MKIFNKTKGTLLADDVILADSFRTRMKGLLGKKDLKSGQALILKPCDSVHTFFMRFAIDVIFVDRQHRVGLALGCLKPWRMSPICWKAQFAVELPSGAILDSRTEKGDEIAIID
jgi:uncharacterized membrane protein (UPF0127 family)